MNYINIRKLEKKFNIAQRYILLPAKYLNLVKLRKAQVYT